LVASSELEVVAVSYGGGESDEVTIKVREGIKVRIEEVSGNPKDDDERMRTDRDLHIVLPAQLKIAVKRAEGGPEGLSRANVATMCG
jgi:hypothetical protein